MTTRASIDVSWDTPSIFYSDRNPNLTPATYPSFLPGSSQPEVTTLGEHKEKRQDSEATSTVREQQEAEDSRSAKMSSDDSDASWAGVEDITETQWAKDVDDMYNATTSSKSSSLPTKSLQAQKLLTSYTSPPPRNAIDLSDSPAQPMTPVTPRRSRSSSQSTPVDWRPNPGYSRDTVPQRGTSSGKGKGKAKDIRNANPIIPSLDDLFADDQDLAPGGEGAHEEEDEDEYDRVFNDDYLTFDVFEDFNSGPNPPHPASTSNTPQRSTTLSTLSAHKPYPMSDPTPHFTQTFALPQVAHPIKLIQDLPPDVQEFYLNHWRRGADKPSEDTGTRGKRALEVESEDESDGAMPTTMSKRRTTTTRGGRGGRGFWVRGRGSRGRGRGAAVGPRGRGRKR